MKYRSTSNARIEFMTKFTKTTKTKRTKNQIRRKEYICFIIFNDSSWNKAAFSCCILLEQEINSHQFKSTDVFVGKPYLQHKCYKKRVTLIIVDISYCTMELQGK